MNKNRLRWACRRGMLELDLILEPFVEQFYETLEEADQLRFEVLLESEDQSLFMWLMKRQSPDSPDMQRIVQIIHESRPQLGWVSA
jgi:antitoxin CptB